MRIAGNYTFEATREEVWSAINDPEVLARTIPGCQQLDLVGENEYETTLKVGLQAVRGVYTGRVKIQDIQPMLSYSIAVDGKGSNGFLKGSGSINLRDDGATTLLDYGGEAQIGGTIASVGQRLLDGAAKTLINQSLKALAAQIEARRNPPPAPPEPEPVPEAVAPESLPAAAVIADSTPPSEVNTVAPASAPISDRRTIIVPKEEQLTEGDVARGVILDLVQERPWVPWVIIAFLIGYIAGRRRS